ncbi:hypothetical protein TI03_04330, partial [Achromatium sp. WMS1]
MVAVTTNLPNTNINDPHTLKTWLSYIATEYNADEQKQIAIACNLAQHLLLPKVLITGETQWQHNLASADILAQTHIDGETLQAALLQGVLDVDSQQNIVKLNQTLVPSVVEMVVSLSHLRLLGDLTSIKHADSKKDHNTH